MLKRMMQTIEEASDVASVRRVFGEPQTVGDTTLIPIAEVAYVYGFGYGGSEEQTDEQGNSAKTNGAGGGGGGGGGQAKATPVAVLKVTPQGTVIEPVMNPVRISLAGIAMAAWSVFWITRTIRAFAKARK